MRKYRLRIGLDVDDILYECNSYALKLLREKYGNIPALDINNIRVWGMQGDILDERISYFSSPDFVASQPLYPGAQKFVRELCKIADVFFVTAVPINCMSTRARRLSEDFPAVPSGNIIIGTRKDVVNFDILLDDGAHNISSSLASYPVLMRRPWNSDLSGVLSVNSYNDFIHLAKMIGNSFVGKKPDLKNGGVLCIVGPSGTGKTEIAEALTADPKFEKPLTTTTRPRLEGEDKNAYRFVTERQFIKERDNGEFIETTVYGKYFFGTTVSNIAPIIDSGRIAVIPIDICGAVTLKNLYGQRALLVFTERNKKDIYLNIINRKISNDDKVSRLMSLDFELRNIELCDFAVNFDLGTEKCVEKIYEELNMKREEDNV